MKYKLKIEFDYEGLEKDEIRDYKLDLVSKDITTEIESDYPIPLPNKDEIITLGEESYSVVSRSHNISKDCYTTTVLVRDKKVASIVENKRIQQLIKQQKLEQEYYEKNRRRIF
jgi:hypothetical protein